MRHLPVTCAVLLLAAVLSSPEASARAPLSFRLGYAGQVSTPRAYDLVDENDHLPLFRVGAAYALPLTGGRLEVEGGFLTGGTSASLHHATEAKLGLTGVELGAAYRASLGSFVEPYAQALIGYDWLGLRVGQLRQDVGQVSATGLLGVSFVLPLHRGRAGTPAFLFDVGAGYGFRPRARFDALTPEPPARSDQEPIPSTALQAGSLPLSGVAYRFQVGLRL
ncbi:porin family protein [Archangium lipolyticum]|uniref:porin family protein n=1 Tax=Archangium lipolyticum TaxID=2970465 RepID=UPI00214A7552|nr:porin family protein [Archangium lipolyticum]